MPAARPARPPKPAYRCSECGWETAKWVGRCGECQSWGSVAETAAPTLRTAAAPVTALKARGVPVLCWTVRTPAQEAAARRVACNITFEQYLA